MADKQIPKLSASGITIGGDKPLEEYLAEKETIEEAEEYISAERRPLYTKPRSKIKTMNGKHNITRLYSRREINKEHWGKLLMNLQNANLSATAQLDRAIIQILLSGKEIIGRDLAVLVRQALPGVTKKSYDIRASHLTRKTDFGRLVEIRRAGNNNCFKLVTAALDLRAEELHVFAYKDMKKREVVLKHHKALRPYFEVAKPDLSEKLKEAKEKSIKTDEALKEAELAPEITPIGKEWSDDIHGSLETALSKALGIAVNISGRIEIVFKLGD